MPYGVPQTAVSGIQLPDFPISGGFQNTPKAPAKSLSSQIQEPRHISMMREMARGHTRSQVRNLPYMDGSPECITGGSSGQLFFGAFPAFFSAQPLSRVSFITISFSMRCAVNSSRESVTPRRINVSSCGFRAHSWQDEPIWLLAGPRRVERAPVRIAKQRLSVFVDSRGGLRWPGILLWGREKLVQAENAHHQHEKNRDRIQKCVPSRIQNCLVHLQPLHSSLT